MNEEIDEVVTIAVMSNGDESIRTITNEYEQSDTCWPHLVEVFLEQLQGLGYGFVSTPEEMADVLNEFHDRCVHEKYACNEAAPVVEEKKYPYTGMIKNKYGITIVEFTDHNIGKCVYTTGHEGNIMGEVSSFWDETLFEKVSE